VRGAEGADHGRDAAADPVYHAGLSADERRRTQEDFMQGRIEIGVATLAFGMGIDKADVRFVVALQLARQAWRPYYQERAARGRDGLPARCLLLFGGGDRKIHEFLSRARTLPARSGAGV